MFAARIAALALALCACTALAQEPAQATLTVIVSDKSTARIPGARVEATNESTGMWFEARANTTGEAVFPLQQGVYFLRVQARGFMLTEEKDVAVTKETQRSVTLRIDNQDWGPTIVQQVEIPTEHQPLEAMIPLTPLQQFAMPAKRLRAKPHWL